MSQPKAQFNLRLDPDTKAWLEKKARESRLSRTWLVNNLIREEIRRDQQSKAS
ncbi:ribbon-helix-helix protein, CopG family [Halomonas elongata]|uniref:ribbon-helix-helix protein, CopG family n=1 Tax=Halomonas elongata TaxID=2746 RepID=UPI00255B342A|nr:ribbon-helix-helix protein, CopG family [Halomonas elongata]MDL4860809.1 ribbon-helix-helix protein, CopG family [Halomonas elongata]